jgi:hypothetical protein
MESIEGSFTNFQNLQGCPYFLCPFSYLQKQWSHSISINDKQRQSNATYGNKCLKYISTSIWQKRDTSCPVQRYNSTKKSEVFWDEENYQTKKKRWSRGKAIQCIRTRREPQEGEVDYYLTLSWRDWQWQVSQSTESGTQHHREA